MKQDTLDNDRIYNDRIFMSTRSYVSEYCSALAKHDENAREFLSNYAYNFLWLIIICKSE